MRWREIFVVGCLAGILTGCSPSGEKLVEERCTTCHTLAPITVERRTTEEWGRVVYRMVSNGAELNDKQAERVVTYLSETYGAP